MANAFRSFSEWSGAGDLARLRSQAAAVRTLLDELDRVLPAAGVSLGEDAPICLQEQLVEEVARLGCRLIESAATMTGVVPPSDDTPAACA